MITSVQLAASTGASLPRADNWLEPLVTAMGLFSIDRAARQAAFLAQIGHESGGLRYVRELWGPTVEQAQYERRRDLGNTRPGDGFLYRGRGPIEITGRANYAASRDGVRKIAPGAPDFEASPEMVEAPRWGAMTSAWFWSSRGLNELADAGDFELITRRINGGLKGLAERQLLWADAKAALGVA